MSDNRYKVVLLGESDVGKRELMLGFTEVKFSPNFVNIQSSHYTLKTLAFQDGKSVTLEIWDTAGQEKFCSLAKIYYKDAKVVILVYDITSEKSFTELKEYWYEQVKLDGRKDVIFVLVANKNEFYQQMQVTYEEVEEFAKSIGAGFFCNSSLSNSGINEMFNYIGKKLLNPNYDIYEENNKAKEEYEKKRKERMNLKTDLKGKKQKKDCIIF